MVACSSYWFIPTFLQVTSLALGKIVVHKIQKFMVYQMITSPKQSPCFPLLFLNQNTSLLISRKCHLSIIFFMFLQTQATCLLLQFLAEVAKVKIISLAMTMGMIFWPFKWSNKPNFKLSTITWFCLDFPKLHNYLKTQFVNK